ncbi:ABC transporter permease [Sporichthya sp.]|uniref:ABC transporter permease n=1 Tax=Sporichthya sp. TaxID=65475 RepID=UPI0017F12B8A|nr:ABC transporter permease [Sporichthya sp.]MBA3743694.1 ABC transporter permease [Sporichthya sp.]
MSLVDPDLQLVVVAVLLAVFAAVGARVALLGVEVAVLTASARAAIQLTIVALVITAVLDSDGLSLLFVAGMLVAASVTSAQRIAGWRTAVWAGLAVAGGAVPVLVLVLASGVVPFSGPAIVAISGIVIGGAMTTSGQAGRRALDELRVRAGEFEAALAIGLDRRAAGLEIARPSAVQALFPPLDQTRAVGLVTLPGAFIGVLLGGGSASEAASAQVLVLFGLLAAEVVAVAVALELVVRGRFAVPVTALR